MINSQRQTEPRWLMSVSADGPEMKGLGWLRLL